MKLVKHRKTGHIYLVISFNIINCTNTNGWTDCVLYFHPYKFCKGLFIREYKEFFEKFTSLKGKSLNGK